MAETEQMTLPAIAEKKPLERMSLYVLAEEEAALLNELDGLLDPEPDPETGEIPDTADRLRELVMVEKAVDKKLEGYLRVIEVFEHRAALADADYRAKKEIIERSHAVAKRAERKVDRLKDAIKQYIESKGETVMLLDSGRGFAIQKNGGKASIYYKGKHIDEALAVDYLAWDPRFYEVVYEADGDAIREAGKAGEELPPGVELFRGTHLKIK